MNQIKLMPIRMIDPVNPGVDVGYERAYGKWSSYVGVAFMHEFLDMATFTNYQGHRWSFEQKYFFQSSRSKIFGAPQYERLFTGIELSHLNVQSTESSRYENSARYIYWDDFDVFKKSYSCNFKIGVQVHISFFVLECYTGVGFKHRNIQTSGKIDPTAYQIDREFRYYSVNDGITNTINLPAGFRVGFIF
ncbi:MAG: hypothetical protein EOP56_13180 [Sphingobacteriales bacterium]|nr:MAG: hypothetical protein EOP56_13180 [Sphingobacteriales bacterium]